MKALDLIDETSCKLERAVAVSNVVVEKLCKGDESKDSEVLSILLYEMLCNLEDDLDSIFKEVCTLKKEGE